MATGSKRHMLLITGGSSGLGLALALHALEQGHGAIATTRSVARARAAHPELEQAGGVWAELDVDREETTARVRELMQAHAVDVLVNGAGFAALGALEDFTDAQCRAQFDTNVLGLLRVCRAAIPLFRANRSGCIVNLGSGAGLRGVQSRALYCGSKFAVSALSEGARKRVVEKDLGADAGGNPTALGITEALAQELAPFGVRVILVELGAFRTAFAESIVTPAHMTADYEDTPTGELVRLVSSGLSWAKGDPVKAAARILEAATGRGKGAEIGSCVRLVLGSDCLDRLQQKVQELQVAFDKNKTIAGTTDFT